jgi:hypothetical protein
VIDRESRVTRGLTSGRKRAGRADSNSRLVLVRNPTSKSLDGGGRVSSTCSTSQPIGRTWRQTLRETALQACWPRTGQTTVVIPQTRYTKASAGTYLAYTKFGEGDQDLVWVAGFATHLEVFLGVSAGRSFPAQACDVRPGDLVRQAGDRSR